MLSLVKIPVLCRDCLYSKEPSVFMVSKVGSSEHVQYGLLVRAKCLYMVSYRTPSVYSIWSLGESPLCVWPSSGRNPSVFMVFCKEPSVLMVSSGREPSVFLWSFVKNPVCL